MQPFPKQVGPAATWRAPLYSRVVPMTPAFALAEVAVVLMVVVVAACVLSLAAARSRSHGYLSGSLANLNSTGSLIASYGSDFNQLTPAFSWSQGNAPSAYPELRNPSNDLQAGAFQAIDILRRQSDDHLFFNQSNWIPHPNHSYLVLADYAGLSLPREQFISPADRDRLNAQSAPPPQTNPARTFRFSSSYEWTTALFYAGETFGGGYLRPVASSLWEYQPGAGSPARLAPQNMAATRFPSQKVFVFDRVQRHFASPDIYFLFPAARLAMLMGDGSAGVRQSGESEVGGLTRANGTRQLAHVDYLPSETEPPRPADVPLETTLHPRFRFTYRLLAGRDFGPTLP